MRRAPPRRAPFCLLLGTAAARAAPAAPPPTRVYNGTDLLRARAAVGPGGALAASYATLIRRADAHRSGPAWSVVNKTLRLPGVSPHNYVSIGIYNHPCNALPAGCKPYPGGKPLPPSDCDNATGLPWVPCDGVRNPGAIAAGDSPGQGAMVNAVQDLALAAFLCNDTGAVRSYASKAASLLRTWFLDNATAMLPNLYYGQIRPSVAAPKKGHGGFIEWAHTARLLDHVELLRYADPSGEWWTAADDAALRRWFAELNQYIEGPEAQGERRMTNNHGSWYDVTWQAVALFAGNASSAAEAAAEVNLRRVAAQILPNGTEWIEVQRNVPSGYCQYNLQALAEDADLAGAGGVVDVWGYATADGRSLRKALDWIVPYAVGGRPWPYPQPEEPSWTKLWEPLRRAAAAYRDAAYEQAACKIMGAAGKGHSYAADPFNLRVPPRYDVTC